MRIIGGKDYYDSAAAYGIDPGIVFVRKEFRLTNGDMDRIGRYTSTGFFIRPDNDEELSYQNKSRWQSGNISRDLTFRMEAPVLIFCGKVYSGIFIKITEGFGFDAVETEYQFWNADKFAAFLEERGWRLENLVYYGEYGYKKLEDKFAAKALTGDALQCLLEKQIVSVVPKPLPFGFERIRYQSTPGWKDQETDYVANSDSLKEWHFQKAFDPVSAFQEISQWVGGTLASYGPKTVEITDDLVKAHKAGFDTKTSFRRPKQVK